MKYRPVIVNSAGKVTDVHKVAYAERRQAEAAARPMVALLVQWQREVGHDLSVRIREEAVSPTSGQKPGQPAKQKGEE